MNTAAVSDDEHGHDERHQEHQQTTSQTAVVRTLAAAVVGIGIAGVPGIDRRHEGRRIGRRGLFGSPTGFRFLHSGVRNSAIFLHIRGLLFFARNFYAPLLQFILHRYRKREGRSASRTHASHFIHTRTDGSVVAKSAFGAFYFH